MNPEVRITLLNQLDREVRRLQEEVAQEKAQTNLKTKRLAYLETCIDRLTESHNLIMSVTSENN